MGSDDFDTLSVVCDFDELYTEGRDPLVMDPDHKPNGREQTPFEAVKVRMVMRIEHCSREEAVRIIAARAEVLRAQEKARGEACESRMPKW